RIAKVQRWFDRYGSFTVFLGRQVAGVRFVTFFTAGTMRVPLWKFVVFDFIGCLVSVPVWMGLGTLASRDGAKWLHAVAGKVGLGFAFGAIVVFAMFLLFVTLRERKATPTDGQKATRVNRAPRLPDRD
ncbi:MAG: VTT domain-containing protein, partial [Polyangiaceae bacterium]|nr:VTT domain-containing protein [Polyangiaceae bacterium]